MHEVCLGSLSLLLIPTERITTWGCGLGVVFFADFNEVIEFGSWIAVKLDVGIGVGWNSIDIGVTQN